MPTLLFVFQLKLFFTENAQACRTTNDISTGSKLLCLYLHITHICLEVSITTPTDKWKYYEMFLHHVNFTSVSCNYDRHFYDCTVYTTSTYNKSHWRIARGFGGSGHTKFPLRWHRNIENEQKCTKEIVQNHWQFGYRTSVCLLILFWFLLIQCNFYWFLCWFVWSFGDYKPLGCYIGIFHLPAKNSTPQTQV